MKITNLFLDSLMTKPGPNGEPKVGMLDRLDAIEWDDGEILVAEEEFSEKIRTAYAPFQKSVMKLLKKYGTEVKGQIEQFSISPDSADYAIFFVKYNQAGQRSVELEIKPFFSREDLKKADNVRLSGSDLRLLKTLGAYIQPQPAEEPAEETPDEEAS